MAGMTSGQIKIPVSIEANIANLKDIRQQYADALSNVKPDEKGYKTIERIIGEMDRKIQKMSQTISTGFTTPAGLNRLNETFQNTAALGKQIAEEFGKFGFENLNLSDGQLQQLNSYKEQIQMTSDMIDDLNKNKFQELAESSTTIKDVLKDLAINVDTSSLDEAIKKIKEKEEQLNRSINGARQKLQTAQTERDVAQGNVNEYDKLLRVFGRDSEGNEVSSRIKDRAALGDFFTTKGKFRKEGKEAFKKYLKEQFALSDEDLDEILQQPENQLGNSAEKLIEAIRKARAQAQRTVNNKNNTIKQQSGLVTQYTEQRDKVSQAGEDLTKGFKDDKTLNETITSLQNQISQLKAEIEQYKAALLEASGVSGAAEEGIGKLTKVMNDNRQATLDAAEAQARVNEQTAKMNRIKNTIAMWFGFNQILNLSRRAIRAIVSDIRELDKVMTEIAVVTNMSQSDLWNQMGTYQNIAKTYGVSTSGVYQVSQLYYQQGLQTSQVMQLTTETLKMAKIAGLDYATATDYMTVAIRGFKMEMSDAQRVVDVYSKVAAVSASDTEELAVAMSKTASSAAAVGSSFENTTAMLAMMIETTRESAENLGSAMKSIISRYGELKSNPSALIDSEGEALSLNKVDTALQSVGIKLHDAQGQFRDFDEVILELSEKWDTLDKNSQRYIATIMAGNRQQSRFLALVSDYDRLKELTEQAANSEDAALVQTLKTMDSLETKIQNVKNAFQGFYGNLGLESLFKGALDIVTNILNRLNQLPKLGKKIPVLAVAIGAQIMNVIKLLLNSAVSLFAKEWTTIGDIIRNNIIRGHKEGTEEGKKQLEKEKADVEGEQLPTGKNKKWMNPVGVGLQALGSVVSINALARKPQSDWGFVGRGWQSIGGGVLSGAGGALTGIAANADKGMPGMIIGGIMGALTNGLPGLITGINDIANAEKLALNAMKDRAEQAKQDSILAKAEVRDLDTTITKLKTLEDARYSSNEAYQEWIDYKNQIVDTYPELLAGYDAEGNAIIDLADSYTYLAEKRQAATLAQLEETEASLEYQRASAEEIDKILEKASQNTRLSNIETDVSGQGLKNLDEMQYAHWDPFRESGNQNVFKASFANGSHVGFTNDMFNLLFNYAGDLSRGFQDSLLSLNLDNLQEIKNLQANDEYNEQEIHDIQQLYGNLIYDTYIKPLAESEMMKEGPYSLDKITKNVERISSEGKARGASNAEIETETFNYYTEILSYFLKEAERLPELQQQIAEIENKKAEINNSFTSSIRNKMVSGSLDNYYLDQIAKSPLMQALNQYHMENSDVDIGTEAYTTEQDKFVDELVKIYKDKGKEVFDEISSVLSRTDQYTSQSAVIEAVKKIYGEDIPEEINDGLIDYIDQSWKNNNKGIQDSFRRNMRGSRQGKNDAIKANATEMLRIANDSQSEISEQYLNAINSQWSDLVTNETNEVTATKNAKFLADTYTKIAQLPPEANNALAGIMSGAELDTIEGIQAAIDAMKAYEAENKDKLEQSDLDLIDSSINALTEHKNNLFINTSLAVQRYISGLDKTIEDANKIYKVQTGGTDDFAEMQATLDKINSTKTDKMGFDEVYKFDKTLGKFVFTVEGLREAQKANLEAINGEWEDITERIEKQQIFLSVTNAKEFNGTPADVIAQLESESQNSRYTDARREYYGELVKLYKDKDLTWEEIVEAEKKRFEQELENGEQANEAAQKLLAQSSKIAAFKAIDFTKIADGTISFAEAENNLITLLGEIYPNEKPEKLENFAKAEYSLISKGGQEAVDRYKALIPDGQEIQSSIIEALLEQPLNAVKNAVSNIKGASIGEAVDLTSLQNVLGEVNLKELFGDNYANGVLTINEEVASTMLNSLQSLRGMVKDQSQKLEVDKIISEYYSSSISELNKFTAGMVASSNLAAVLANNDIIFSSQLQLQGQIVLKTAKDFIRANEIIYESASKAYEDGVVSLSNLNTSFLNSINANLLQKTSSMSILSSASSFDLNALNEFLTVYGERLDTFVDNLGEVIDDNAGIQAFGNGKYRIVDWDKFRARFAANLSKTSEEYIDAYINFLTNSQDSKVNSKEALMTTLLPKLDSLTYAEIGQIAKRFGLTVDTVISYLEQNADGTFNGNALVNELDFNKYDEAFVKALNERESSIATDMVSAIVAFSESSKGLYDNKVLGEAVDKYNKALQSLGKTTNLTLFDAERILLNGGEQAVALAEQIARAGGQELSAQDIETIYRGAISKLTNAIDTIAAQEGAIIDRTTADIIAGAGGRVNELGQTGQFVVEKAANLYEAYKNLLDRMVAIGEATLADLNKVAALSLENKDRAGVAAEQQVIDALGDAAGMTYTRFGEILAQQGKELSEDLVNALEQSGIIKSLGGSRMMITDFSSFAEIMNWSADSEQYISAFKSYNDSLIQMNRQAENNILEEVKKVGDAKGGDWVNLTQLMSGIDDVVAVKLETRLQQFGGFIDDGILKLEPSANIPAIMQEIAQAAAESGGLLSDELAELADAVADTIKGYADLIKGAIKGSLTSVQAEQLQDWATQVGIGQLDFTPTQEGLKVAIDQVMQLYEELSKIDSIQGQLVFDELADSLRADKGGDFFNATTTMAAAARIQQQIEAIDAKQKELTQSGNVLLEEDKSRYEMLDRQRQVLLEQKQLYTQLAQEMAWSNMDNPDSYNFMNQSLPETMQGPINYWNSWGQAFSAMREAGQTGKMEIQDFYNIVGEMNNLMAASGQTLQLGAYELDGSAESAAALIKAGMDALTNIDGKGVKINLKEIGVDFASGAEGMDTNLEEGIHTMARSQIKMLDAAIAVLEAIVAMDQLGEVDTDKNGILSVGEIFNDDGSFTETFENVANTLRQSEELKPLLENLKINGLALGDLLNTNSDAWKKVVSSEEEYAQIMTALYQASQSGDYDLDNLVSSVMSILQGTGQVFSYYDEETGTETVIKAGHSYTIDWNDEEEKEKIYQAFEKAGIPEGTYTDEQIRDILNQGHNGGLTGQKLVAYELTYGIIAEVKENGKTSGYKAEGDETVYSTPEEAMIAAAFAKQKGEEISKEDLPEGGQTRTYEVDNGFVYSLTVDVDGKETYKTTVSGANGEEEVTGSTYEEMIQNALIKMAELDQKEWDNLTPEEQISYRQKLGLKIEPSITVTDEETFKRTTREQVAHIIDVLNKDPDALPEELRKIGVNMVIDPEVGITEEQRQELATLLGYEDKIVNTTINLGATTGDPRLVELVTTEGTITKEMELDLTTTGDLSENFINAINNLNPANLMVVAFNLAAMSSSLKTISGATFQNVDDMKTRWDEILAVVKEVAEAIASIGDIKLPTPSGNGGDGGSSGGGKPEVIKPGQVSRRGTTDQATGGAVSAPGVSELTEKVGVLNTNATNAKEPVEKIATSLGSIAPENATTAQNFTSAINDIKADGVNNAENYKDAVNDTGSTGADNASAFKRAVNDIPDKSGAINRLKNALDGISGVLNLTLKVSLDVSGLGPAKGTVSGVSSPATWRSNHIGGSAYYHYNRAYAKGTLMGELGPELVVSHGRYFVVGQNGPEMVDLADDAIVFNHLQTRKLLANGKISSHGSPVTNERNATSFATGNMEGDALASPSAALSALKQLRAMWQSMLDASLLDLGRTAGPGGSGGGGSGSGSGNDKDRSGLLKDVERWYNWLRRIKKLQDAITLSTKQQTLLESDQIANGREIYHNLRERIELLKQERDTQLALADSQRDYYEQSRRQFEATKYTRFYKFNDNGQLELVNDEAFANDIEKYLMNNVPRTGVQQTTEGGGGLTVTFENGNIQLDGRRVARDENGEVKRDDKGNVVYEDESTDRHFKMPSSGLKFLDELFATTASGQARYSIDEQFAILRAAGFSSDMLNDENGKTIFKSEKDMEDATVEQMERAVQAWMTKMDQWKDHFDGLSDSIQEAEEQALDLQAEIQKLEEEIAKRELDLEKRIMQALKDRRQAEIDNLQSQRDAYSDAADKMVNGLSEQLDKERQMYQSNQNQEELDKLQRQLAILQRSGGSGSQIQSLQEQIRSKQQDIYFDERQQQIDAIKEASDKQLEKMDNQIDLMQRTLQYEEEHGLLWREVRDIMTRTPEEIADYIARYSSDYQASSALDRERQGQENLEAAQFYRESQEDKARAQNYSQRFAEKKYKRKSERKIAREAYESAYLTASGTNSERIAAARQAAEQAVSAQRLKDGKKAFATWITNHGVTEKKGDIYKEAEKGYAEMFAKKLGEENQTVSSAKKAANAWLEERYKVVKKKLKRKKNAPPSDAGEGQATNSYDTGGLVDKTGLAWLDGTKSKPEYVLSAKQTAFLRDELLNSRESMSGLVAELRQMFNGGENAVLSAVNNSTSTDEGIKIQHLDVNMNVASLGSDYDVEQAANAMFNKMTKIARKSGTRSVARR